MTDHVFLRIMQLLPSFVGTPKNEIPGAALELCKLKIKQFSPDILKFSTKHKDNPFTLNCYMVPCTFLFLFHAGSHRLGSNNFQNWSYKEKTTSLTRVPDHLFISYDYFSTKSELLKIFLTENFTLLCCFTCWEGEKTNLPSNNIT